MLRCLSTVKQECSFICLHLKIVKINYKYVMSHIHFACEVSTSGQIVLTIHDPRIALTMLVRHVYGLRAFRNTILDDVYPVNPYTNRLAMVFSARKWKYEQFTGSIYISQVKCKWGIIAVLKFKSSPLLNCDTLVIHLQWRLIIAVLKVKVSPLLYCD